MLARKKKPFISHVLPTSWLSKFKQMGIQKPTRTSPSRSSGITRESPCYDDDDAFWRYSFSGDGKRSCGGGGGGVLRSVLYDSGDEVDFPGGLGCRSCKKDDRKVVPRDDRSKKFSDMVSDIRRRRELSGNVEGSMDKRRDRRLAKSKGKVCEFERDSSKSKAKAKCNEPEEKVIWEVQRDNCDSRLSVEEDHILKALNFEAKSDNERKSLYISRESQKEAKPNRKVRVNSPRTASKIEICKIKALEDMKRAKMKTKSKNMTKERTELESFAVVKCSFDPQKDFRESMIEMIAEKKIRSTEEFEELLACYLTLNSDEYHDLIIKVFRQVWFEVNHNGFGHELLNQHCCYE